jgi:vacuolar-type H+-ATPase subunit H
MEKKKEIVNEREKFTVMLYNKYLEEQGKNAEKKKMSNMQNAYYPSNKDA